MNKLKKGICFGVLIITLTGMLTAVVTVQGYTTFQGTVEDRYEDPVSYATIILADCYCYIIAWTTTNIQGYYSFSVTLNGNSPYKLSASKTGFITEVKENIYSEGTYDFVLGEKIAVFFYATNAYHPDTIAKYKGYLQEKGYSKFFEFANSEDVESDCETVDDYEFYKDIVFI